MHDEKLDNTKTARCLIYSEFEFNYSVNSSNIPFLSKF